MKIIGLCGGSGSGKGCVSAILSQYGYAIFDTDKIYHVLLESSRSLFDELIAVFGDGILSEGRVDRKKLGGVVFSDKSGESLRALNKIAHAHILAEVRRGIVDAEKSGAVCAVVDAPLLFESRFDEECDLTVAVISDREKRISRIMMRDSIDKVAAEKRIDAQITDERLMELCNYVIFNNGDLDDLKCEVEKIVSKII